MRLDYRRRDEIGSLVDGFNRMSARLAETTSRLIEAEKAAAWQQTARVIAHGIKNILAPLKLALTRLAGGPSAAAVEGPPALATLQAQLERLEKTARDFSLYGCPVREPNAPVDVNMAVRQAVRLCGAQCGATRIDRARPGLLSALPCRDRRPARSPPRLRLYQLCRLRSAAVDRHRRSVRPCHDDDGAVRALRQLSPRGRVAVRPSLLFNIEIGWLLH